MKPLYDYTDYRACLADWLAQRKAEGLPVSNRWFAMKMGVNSSSWLTSILQGKKNLSPESARRLSELMKLDERQARFFAALVRFNQARDLDERNRCYAEMNGLRNGGAPKKVGPAEYEYYAQWYHSAVRSIIGMHGFDGTFDRLAAMVSPPITASQAKKSVALLTRLGFLVRTGDGGLRLADAAITTGDRVRSLAVATFQRETMRLAQEALDRYPAAEREIRATTLGVSRKTVDEIRAILTDARQRIIELANGDDAADRVYQLNLQLFPLSKPPTPPGKQP